MNKTKEIPQPIWIGRNKKYKLTLKYQDYQINSDVDGITNPQVVTNLIEIVKFYCNQAIIYGFVLLIAIACNPLDLISKIGNETVAFLAEVIVFVSATFFPIQVYVTLKRFIYWKKILTDVVEGNIQPVY